MSGARSKTRKSVQGQTAGAMARKSTELCESTDDLALGLEEELDEEEGGLRIGDIYVPPPPPPSLTYDCTGPRLIISHIENVNFKSYAGKEILGPFHKSFTSIVGPNGSGKSNVIDSMLFVFGYRAQKIRSKKIGVLIHNSNKHPNLQKCTVTVYFEKILDKGNDFERIQGTSFKVSRTASKDNSSFYEIDGRRATFKEVGNLLRLKGIDLDHNRFLILQGEVEQIAMMKAKAQTEHDCGMLEYLEDIIGSHRFKKPIETLSVQVEDFSERRTEMLNKVKTLETEKNSLEGPRNETIQYLKKENKITFLKNKLIQGLKFDKETQLKKANERYEEAKKELETVEKYLTKVKDQLEEKDKEHKAKSKEATKCVKKYEEKDAEFKKLENKDTELREALKFAKTKIKLYKKQLLTEDGKLEELQNLPEQVQTQNKELEKEKNKLEEKLTMEETKLAAVMATLRDETKELQQEKEQHENKLIGLKAKVDETKSALNILQTELNVYLSAEQKEKIKIQSLTLHFEKITNDIKDIEKNMKQVEQQMPATKQKLQQIQNDLKEANRKEVTLTAKLRDNRMRVEETRCNQQALKSRGRVFNEIMKLKDKKIRGIYGRLGDLGAIDEKYDIAISTACGPLDNFVTDTMETAQACVQHLKANDVGVATFIALDKMEKWIPYTTQKIQTPENVPRLFDLVKVNDNKVLPAFYYALQNTLVAQNLDQATRIALQGTTRNRVVTLKGELIEKAGTMSGGGGRVSRGRMGQSVVVGQAGYEMDGSMDITGLQREIDSNVCEVEELRTNIRSFEEQGRNLERDFRIMGQNKEKWVRELELLNVQLKGLKTQITEQKERVAAAAPDQNEVKRMQKPIDAAEIEFDKASEAAGIVSTEVKLVQERIDEITKNSMGNVKKTVNSLKKRLDEIQTEIMKGNVAAKSAGRNMKKCEEKIASLKEDIAEFEKTIATSGIKLKELEIDAQKIMEECKTSNEGRELIEDELKAIVKGISEIKNKSKHLQEEHIDAKNEYGKYSTLVGEMQKNIKLYEEQLEKMSLHKMDDLNTPDEEENYTELPKLAEDELEVLDLKEIRYKIETTEQYLKDKNCNMMAIETYKRKEKQYLDKVDELETITEERDTKRKYYDQLKKERLTDFMNGFTIITNKLKEVYQMLTQGGDAELELVDSLDPFSDGIVFSVRPPKKSWKNISNLSGGEKTLSSLALVMALHYYRPTPLYVMDEIDAALDFRNVSIVGHYIKERTKNAQFIVISLRNNMYELADRLVGIYKTYDCTKSVTLDSNKEIEATVAEPVKTIETGKTKETESMKGTQPTKITKAVEGAIAAEGAKATAGVKATAEAMATEGEKVTEASEPIKAMETVEPMEEAEPEH